MKKIFLVLTVIFQLCSETFACTTFFLNRDGQLIFGRNYDWISGEGMVCTNNRGLHKTSMKVADGRAATWVSRYGSMTFNQYGKEFPTGGMNEKGLVVELMWEEKSKYPDADNRPALGVLQWIQYQLDNYSNIEEVIAGDATVRISQDSPPLHYLIADANGNAATIEFFNGKMKVHKGKDLPFPVLANSPYDQSAANIQSTSNTASQSFRDNSQERFAKACSMVQQFQKGIIDKPVVEYAYNILDNVSQGNFTKWSIVYDMVNKKVFFKTEAFPTIKSFSFRAFDFNCSSASKVIDMNQAMEGEINKRFVPFNIDINRRIVEKAVIESRSQVPISEKGKEALINYTSRIQCE